MRAVQVMQMFDKAEAEFRELSDKRVIVENDKNKIQKVPPEPMQLQPPPVARTCSWEGKSEAQGHAATRFCGWGAGLIRLFTK